MLCNTCEIGSAPAVIGDQCATCHEADLRERVAEVGGREVDVTTLDGRVTRGVIQVETAGRDGILVGRPGFHSILCRWDDIVQIADLAGERAAAAVRQASPLGRIS